jgi:plastocyanin
MATSLPENESFARFPKPPPGRRQHWCRRQPRLAADAAAPDAQDDPVAAPTLVDPSGVEIRVIAIDNIFRPELIEVAVGDDVVWENRGMNEHNILSIEGPAPGSPVGDSESIGWFKTADDVLSWGVTTTDFQPGDTFTYRFAEPGEYRYYCAIHGTARVGMVGTIVVTG